MRKNNITDIRYWLAETIIRIFNIGADNDKIFKTKFYIYNIESFNGPKIITISKPNKKRMVDVDKWMSKENLFKIWIDLNNRERIKKYFLISNCWRTSNNEDIWISMDEYIEPENLSKQIKLLIAAYKSIRNLKNAQELIGGSRKYLKAYFKTLEKVFNKQWLEKIRDLFDGYNFTHNNEIGEEWKDNGQIKIKLKNEKLKNMSESDLFNLCDYLVKSLDIMYAALDNEKLLRK